MSIRDVELLTHSTDRTYRFFYATLVRIGAVDNNSALCSAIAGPQGCDQFGHDPPLAQCSGGKRTKFCIATAPGKP